MKITHRKITAGTIKQFPSKKINNEVKFHGDVNRFQGMFYDGQFLDSYDGETPLEGWCWCVGYSDDDDGNYWRVFSDESWDKVKDLTNEEIYSTYPASPNVDDMYACTDVEGATVEELQEAMNKRLAKNEELGDELDNLQQKAKKKAGFFGFGKKKANAASEVTKIDETADSISYVVASDEDHYYDIEQNEGSCSDINCKTLVRYKGYKLMPDDNYGGWNVFNKNSDLVKRDLFTEQEAKEYVDSIASSTDISCVTDLSSIDTDILKNEIEDACIEYLTGPKGGFKHPGEPREDRWDIFADEMFTVDVDREDDHIRIEVRAELDYDGMTAMAEYCDQVIQKYDPNSYFEQVDGCIMDAYIYDASLHEEINSSEDISGVTLDDINEDVIRRHSDNLNPPEYEAEEIEEAKSVFMFDITVTVADDGNWSITEGDPLYHADILDENGITEDKMNEDFLDLIEWNVPAQPGKYILKGKAKLVYEKDPIDSIFSFVPSLSAITDLETTGDGKVESSTDVSATEDIKAAMTEEDLDYAIDNGKPFDLDSFKKYKNPDDPDALVAAEVQVDDVIQIDSAEEVNWGTVVKIISINDPDLVVNWSDFVFHCEIINGGEGTTQLTTGDVVDLHFLADESVGYLLKSGI